MKDRPKVETKEKIDMNCYPYTGGGQGVGIGGESYLVNLRTR